MIARIAARRALSSSIAARQQTVNEHGGWICKDRAEFEKYWPVVAEKQALHTAQMKAHIPVHEQGSNGPLKAKVEMAINHVMFAFCLLYGFKCLAMELN
jgi:hypothetical protein